MSQQNYLWKIFNKYKNKYVKQKVFLLYGNNKDYQKHKYVHYKYYLHEVIVKWNKYVKFYIIKNNYYNQ